MATKYQNYITNDDGVGNAIYGNPNSAGNWVGQTFTVSTPHRITYVVLKLYRTGSPGIIQCDLYNGDDGTTEHPTGTPIASGTYDGDTITTDSDGEWVTITFDAGYNLSADTYAIVLKAPSGDGSNYIFWRADTTASSYSGGTYVTYTSAVGSWQHTATTDNMFEEWGISTQLNEKQYTTRLLGIGNNEFWYSLSNDELVELSAANGDIDTNELLNAVVAYQKIFIANKTNLKIADFINVKISTADAGANPTTPGMTLTGGTSSATMIVDYADGVTDDSAALIYGYLTSSTSFTSGETVTGTNSDGNAVSFVLDANEDTGPHWYDWTVFGNDTSTYGTMPTSSTLVALYRGRLVLNDVLRPHAWYMSKVGNPFKFLYDFDNDADLSAVAYSNAQVGEVGDIITAFITYKDDLFIFGCASSIWMLVGDPLAEGQLSQITDSTGVWGSRAWCMDNNKNLYFLGVDGIYQMAISETSAPPTNISKQKLPNLMSDLDLDQESHRVVLSFDPDEQGILISKTALSDGTNTNYFYSLITGGYFQETYPTSCGIFSAYYYPATDDTYKKFLVGCTDGYIREFDGSTKNDTTTSSTSAISSYATTIFMLGQDEDHVGMLRELRAIVAGGASGGDFSDSDGLSFELHKANDAETVLEDIKDGATAFTSGSWSTTGKQNKIRPRMRGSWAGLKLYNSTASETWSVEKIIANIEPKGGIE